MLTAQFFNNEKPILEFLEQNELIPSVHHLSLSLRKFEAHNYTHFASLRPERYIVEGRGQFSMSSVLEKSLIYVRDAFLVPVSPPEQLERVQECIVISPDGVVHRLSRYEYDI